MYVRWDILNIELNLVDRKEENVAGKSMQYEFDYRTG